MSDLERDLRASVLQKLTLRMATALRKYGACTPECRGRLADGGCACGAENEIELLVREAARCALPVVKEFAC